ncbi:hypothetical protein F4808DRAFT_440836 [Astrocystis sublimbata]|nr:hypothetical protein F4808DRAFT_440836 [Astrocystis sublimbata]
MRLLASLRITFILSCQRYPPRVGLNSYQYGKPFHQPIRAWTHHGTRSKPQRLPHLRLLRSQSKPAGCLRSHLFPLSGGDIITQRESNYPIVTQYTTLFFHNRCWGAGARFNLMRALMRMLRFYGFDYKIVLHEDPRLAAGIKPIGECRTSTDRIVGPGTRLKITPRQDCEDCFRRWITRDNHHHLRIARILRSLRILGLGGASLDFYNALMEAITQEAGVINPNSIADWTRAVEDPAYRDFQGNTIEWLRQWNGFDYEIDDRPLPAEYY